MKLNYKRTILVGFAFFLICAFWQAYDKIVHLILTKRFFLDEVSSGFLLALDNIFAIFMLPLFGSLSDKTHTRFGKRTPYIVLGTVIAALALPLLGAVGELWQFIVLLLVCLIAMSTFRSPAVALMPDVTPKPLRSRGNAVINLLGTAGGIIVLGFGIVFNTDTTKGGSYTPYLIAVSCLMLVALTVFLLTVRERAWAIPDEPCGEPEDKPSESERPASLLSKSERSSLLLLLTSVALWFIAYNAITSRYSYYAMDILHMSYDETLLIAQIAAIIAYLPVGFVAARLGRRRTVLIGVALLTGAFLSACFVTSETTPFLMYVLFALAGIGWANINVNSFPMVVELARGGDVGKYTGYYYTASMAAQVVTPVLSGILIRYIGWEIFFPYATFFAACAFVTMLFVRHGDSRPQVKDAVCEALGAD